MATAELLKTASDWFEDVRDDMNAFGVVYNRGVDSVALDASVGQRVWEVDIDRGIYERWVSRDFIVLAAELILDGAVVEPQAGDTIIETRGADVYTYECMAPRGESSFEYADGFRKSWRIHSKLITQA